MYRISKYNPVAIPNKRFRTKSLIKLLDLSNESDKINSVSVVYLFVRNYFLKKHLFNQIKLKLILKTSLNQGFGFCNGLNLSKLNQFCIDMSLAFISGCGKHLPNADYYL